MANEPRRRTARAPQTPQNSTKLGVILVAAAVLVGLLIFSVGGGTGNDDGRTAAEQAQGGDDSATTTEPEVLAPTTQPLASLRLVIANASGVSGRAGATRDKFTPLGYSNTAPVDANAQSDTTYVYYAPGFDVDANAIAVAMGLTPDRVVAMPQPQPLKTPDPSAQVIAFVGKDFDPATAAWNTAAGATN